MTSHGILSFAEFRTSASAHGLLSSRRRLRNRRADRRSRAPRNARRRRHRPRQSFRRREFLPPGHDARREADHRLRSVRRAGQSQESRRGRGALEPSGPALRERRGLPQPDQAGFHRISRRLLLQAARGSRSAGAAQQRTDRAFRLPARRSGRRAALAKNTIRRAPTPTACATFSARGISFSKCRTRAWKSRRASIAIWSSSRARPAFRWWPPTIATT